MLAVQAQERVIGGVRYSVQPLAAGVALRLMARAMRLAAPAFADLRSIQDAAKITGAMLAGLLTDLDDATLEMVTGELAKVTQVHGENDKAAPLAVIYDEHFRGRIVEQIEWLRFAGEVTYGPLGARLTAMASEAAQVQPPAQDQPSP
jgi:hypothetical protein